MKKKPLPITMAVLWGIGDTTALKNRTLGICVGLIMETASGLFYSDKMEHQE